LILKVFAKVGDFKRFRNFFLTKKSSTQKLNTRF